MSNSCFDLWGGMGAGLDRDPNAQSHPSPYRNYLQKFTPRHLKELFKWCEYLYYNSPHVYAALRKFGEYPITTITYNTPNKALRIKHEFLLEKIIKVREQMMRATLDKYVYGNSFTTMYQPFIRYLCCPKCGALTNIRTLSYVFNLHKLTFTYSCTNCNNKVVSTRNHIKDRKLMLSRKVNFIRWDPKLMDIDYNEITGESDYYYTIPQSIIHRVNAGHKTLIDTVPLGFLDAIRKNKKFKFAPNAVYHMKTTGPAGVNPQWGLPPLLAVMSRFHYTEVLRKANESIALDYLVPFRVLHPAQSSANGDPIMQMSLTKWEDSIKTHLKQWRRDPLHIMFSPVPVGATQVGGQGRALLTLGEVQEAEKNMVAALGIPMEFLYGGLTGSGMEATLRLIENQLETHIQDLLELLQWIDDKCAKFLGWETIPVSMTKFRMVDDQYNKQAVFQMWQTGQVGQGPKVVSTETVTDMYNIDISDEQKKVRQEELDRIQQDQEMQLEAAKIQNSMREEIRQLAQSDGSSSSSGYDQQQIIKQADDIVQQLLSMDDGMKKSQLHQLQVEDYILYSVVIQRLEQAQTINKQQNIT